MGNEVIDGTQLFRELLRYFGGAALDEYYKNGVWDIELLNLDTELMKAHREEAGDSDKIPPLEDIPEVKLPEISEMIPPWKQFDASPKGKGKSKGKNGIMLNPGAQAMVDARGIKRPLSEVQDGGAIARKGKKGKAKGELAQGKGVLAPGKGAQMPGKGKGLEAKGKGLDAKGGAVLDAKGFKGKGKGKAAAVKGAKGGVVLPPGQLLEKGSKKGMKKGAPAYSKAPQLLQKGKQKGDHKGFKGAGKGPLLPGAGSVPYSKASSPAFTKAGSMAVHRAGKFARRAARKGPQMSKAVVEKFLDADDLD